MVMLPKMYSPELGKKSRKKEKITQLNIIFHPFAPLDLLGRFVPFLAGRATPPTQSSKPNVKSIDSAVWGLRVPKIRGFPLTLIVALTTALCTTVLQQMSIHKTPWLTVYPNIRTQPISPL